MPPGDPNRFHCEMLLRSYKVLWFVAGTIFVAAIGAWYANQVTNILVAISIVAVSLFAAAGWAVRLIWMEVGCSDEN